MVAGTPSGQARGRGRGPRSLSAGSKGARRRRLIGLLKLLLAVLLLVWVGASLPWSDVLVHGEGEEALLVRGTIEGDWRSARVRFRPAADQEVGPEWPPELAAAARAGEALVVERASATGASGSTYDWRPSMPRVFREMDPRGLAAALIALLGGALFAITRWWRILALAGCRSSWVRTLRFTFLGMFFNLVVPGLTGGDVVKAVLVVREHPERRADALVSVVIDRMLGLWLLIGLACAVVLFGPGGLEVLRWPVLLGFLAASAAVALVLASSLRRALRVDALLLRLPQARRLAELDRAAKVFSRRPFELALALALSAGNHLCVFAGVLAIGHAFGDTLAYLDYVAIVSISNVLSSLPLTPGGWGVGEKAFGSLFELSGSAFALGVAVSVTYRLCNMGLGLLGGCFLLSPGGSRVREEVREAELALGDESPSL